MGFFNRLGGFLDGSNRVLYDRIRAVRHHIFDNAQITLGNVQEPYRRLIPIYLKFVDCTCGVLSICFSHNDRPAIMTADLRLITPDQGHVLFTQTLVGFMMYSSALNIQAVPILKSLRDALLKFAEVTTGMESVVTAAQSRFAQFTGFDGSAFIELIESNILSTIPNASIDMQGRMAFMTAVSNVATALAVDLYKAALTPPSH